MEPIEITADDITWAQRRAAEKNPCVGQESSACTVSVHGLAHMGPKQRMGLFGDIPAWADQ
jgi:hypothetical protein